MILEGLTAVISLQIPENLLQFEGQTKAKLGTQKQEPLLKVLLVKITIFLRRK